MLMFRQRNMSINLFLLNKYKLHVWLLVSFQLSHAYTCLVGVGQTVSSKITVAHVRESPALFGFGLHWTKKIFL